jgi:hypothetical protein
MDDSAPPKRLSVAADAAVEFVAPNHLLFVMQSALFSQKFDPNNLTLSGDPVRLGDQITVDGAMNRAALSVSNVGSIIYRTGSGVVSVNSCGSTGAVRKPSTSASPTAMVCSDQRFRPMVSTSLCIEWWTVTRTSG